MKGHPIPYSHEELEFIKARSTLPRRELRAAFVEAFDRPDLTIQSLHALCKRKGWLTGRSGRYEKGRTPENKGKVCPPGKGGRHPNARATQFKRGNRSGVALTKYKPIGTERLSKEGYLERKVHDGMPRQSRWRSVHLINWEAVHGPVPKGHCLKCLDGDHGNTDPSNWTPVPRAMLPRLNGRHGRNYDSAPAELKPVIMTIVKLEHQARSKSRGASRS